MYTSFSHVLSTAQGGLFIVSGHFKFHNRSFEVWQLEFIQLSVVHTQQPVALFQGLFLIFPPPSSPAGLGPGGGHPGLSGED